MEDEKILKNVEAFRILLDTNNEVIAKKIWYLVERNTVLLQQVWGFDEAIIKQVVIAMEGSFDESDSYLDIMDSEGIDDPSTEYIWEMFCDKFNMDLDNPFN